MKSATILLFMATATLMTIACKEKKDEPATTAKPINFLPVIDFLKSEINHIDTVPYSFIKYTIRDDKTDSTYINKAEFHQMVDEFTQVDIGDKKYIQYYDETALIDTSTKLASFTYLANNDEMKVARIDAYVNPETQQFKKLFIKINDTKGDTLVSKQLLWQTSGNFVLLTTSTIGNKEQTSQVKVVWDDKEE